MRRLLVFSALILALAGLQAQTRETWDITTFTAPRGWKKETAEFAVSYVVTNGKTGGWCRVTIYKSQQSSGDPSTDFANEWKAILAKKQRISDAPTAEATDRGGWTQLAGAGKYRFDGKDALAVLITLSGFGAEVTVLAEMNSNEFMEQTDAIVASLELARPAVAQKPAPQPPAPAATQPAGAAPVTSRPGNQGITMATTGFDDGWTAQPFADYVRLTKGSTTLLLHFGIAIDDQMRSGDMLRILWDRLIVPRYNVSGVRELPAETITFSRVYFYEADAVDRATGKRQYMYFKVIPASGIATCVEITGPSRAEVQKQFPTQESIEVMLNANRFAVAQADVVGTWEESTSSAINMYNSVTGAYAGMSTTGGASTFVLNTDGTYLRHHRGAFGTSGNMTFFDNKYEGRYTVSPWEITFTDRSSGKVETFAAQYQAVRGGRILHITNKAATGIRYSLARTK